MHKSPLLIQTTIRLPLKKLLCLMVSGVLLTACNNDNNNDSNTIFNPVTPTTQNKPINISILHINDSHSHLDEEITTLKLETSAGKKESIIANFGGAARVTALIKELANANPNSIKVHDGDAVTGDLYFNLGEGKAEADMMNTVCFDTFTLGNHEFDNGDAGLKKFLGFLDNGTCKTNTQALSANTNFGSTSPLYGTSLVKPYQILERDGQKIAFIGLTIAGKTKTSSRPDANTTFSDELATAQAQINALKAQGINKIVLQAHTGYEFDQSLAKQLSGVDVIISGDSHSLLAPSSLANYGFTPAGDYPTKTTDKDGKTVCIAQAWQYNDVVGKLDVSFDSNGDVLSCGGQPYVLLGDQFKRADSKAPALTADEVNAIKTDINNSGVLKIVTPDANAMSVLAPYKAQKDALAKEQVAIATDNLCLRRIPGIKRDTTRSSLGDVCNKNERVNLHGGDIQQIVAEAFLLEGKKYFHADISVQNGGGVRVDVPQGAVTVGKVYEVLPFKNTLVELKATGQEVKNALEDAVEGVLGNNNSGGYPYTGGLRWDIDLNQPKGYRISNLQVKDANNIYQPLDMTKTYSVITNNFVAEGQDYYTAFKAIPKERRTDVGLDYAQAFLNYINSLAGDKGTKPLSLLPNDNYSTHYFVDTP